MERCASLSGITVEPRDHLEFLPEESVFAILTLSITGCFGFFTMEKLDVSVQYSALGA